MDNNELKHFGKLGMKWGSKKASGNSSPSKQSSVKKQLAKIGGKKVKPTTRRLTDQQLRAKINRIQMERQYAQLTPSKTDKGKKIVMDILGNAAKQTATNYAAKYMGKGVEMLLKGATPS